MESKTTRGLCDKVQKETQSTVQKKLERRQYGEYEEDYESDGDSRPKKKDYDLSL